MEEPFTLIEESGPSRLYDTFQDITSAKIADNDIQYLTALRKSFPECNVTCVPTANCNLLAFAHAGHANIELDLETDSFASWRGWIPSIRAGQTGSLAENVTFAKYRYQWASEAYILYTVRNVQYILKEIQHGENQLSHSSATDALIAAAGSWQTADQKIVWVYDNGWRRSKELFSQVEKAEWKNVILDSDMKKTLTDVSTKFFDSRDVYEDLGVPWKRGLIFYGPAGNGKTISIKALMHTLLEREVPVPTLYIKAAPSTWAIRAVFTFARTIAPCLLVFEDIDTVITANTRSYFFNECDGLENNDGILMVASTNHLDRLDPGVTKRPSRFDRKYLFPLPSEIERKKYCQFWRHKLEKKQKTKIDFPEKLCPAIAGITDQFSFAYMQEAFVATLLAIARDEDPKTDDHDKHGDHDDDKDNLDNYRLWTVMKKQVALLREDMQSQAQVTADAEPVRESVVRDVVVVSSGHEDQSRGQGALPAVEAPVAAELPNRKFLVFNPMVYAWQ